MAMTGRDRPVGYEKGKRDSGSASIAQTQRGVTMAMLDPKQGYVLAGSDAAEADSTMRNGSSPPSAIHLRLSPSLLELIMSGNDQGLELHSFGTDQPCITMRGGEKYPLQHTAESSPHQLYRKGVGSTTLHLVGDITSKLASPLDGHASTSSSAATRLKERRELEEARKSEHRTVMIDSPLISEASKPKTSSKLKLRPKGLAHSATNTPLIRSRAGTPVDTGSVMNSPNLHLQGSSLRAQTPPMMPTALPNTQGSSSVKPSPLGGGTSKGSSPSPPTLRRRLTQILARGPLSGRTIVRLSHQPEPAVIASLAHIAHAAPEEMQPSSEISSKKFSGPLNRRTSVPGQQPASLSDKNEAGPNTVYILNDLAYRDVMIKDWAEYDMEERQAVSEMMEAALRRLKVDTKADEWKRLYPDGRGRNAAREGGDLSNASRNGTTSSSGPTREGQHGNGYSTSSSSLAESPTKSNAEGEGEGVLKAASKKKGSSTMSRLQKAAKGKGSVAPPKIGTRSTATTGSTKETKGKDSSVGVAEGSTKDVTVGVGPSHPLKKTDSKDSKGPPKSVVKTATNAIKAMSRKDIEYTDSSDDGNDEMQTDSTGPALPVRRSPLKVDKSSLLPMRDMRAPSSSPDGKRQRRGVGAGAALTAEPWLDVRSRSDWQRLAERFGRVYGEYAKERLRLQEEQGTIKAELELAFAEQATVTRRGFKLEIDNNGGSKTKSQEAAAKDDNDEDLEEGEAIEETISPAADVATDPTLYHNVGWRQENNTGKTDVHPLSIEELQTRIRQLRDKEAQLGRMKSTLQSSKQALESVNA